MADVTNRANVHQGHLMATIEDFTSSQAERLVAQKWFKSLRQEWGDGDELTGQLAGVLYEGLSSGNWPWVAMGTEDEHVVVKGTI